MSHVRRIRALGERETRWSFARDNGSNRMGSAPGRVVRVVRQWWSLEKND